LGVHGWVYSIETGIIKDMNVSTFDNANMSKVFRFDRKVDIES
jgi:carbonic anhydrase